MSVYIKGMSDCEHCRNYWNNGKDEYCEKRGWDFKRTDCPDFRDKGKPITNADRLRAMSVEELAEFLYDGCCRKREAFPCSDVGCKKCWLDWLKEGVSTNG
jgi:hypothetical protein